MFQKFSLRARVGLALGAAIAFSILLSSLIITRFVEGIVLEQAEVSLLDRVRDTALTVSLLADRAQNPESVKTEIEKLRAELKTKKLLKTGYYYILDASGTFVLHPSKEGENVLNATDLDGRPIFKQILEMEEGQLRYRWMNAETQSPQDKVAVCKRLPSLSWAVCASLNEAEVYESIQKIRWIAVASCFVLVLLLMPGAIVAASKVQVYLLRISKKLLGSTTVLSASSRLLHDSSDRINQNADSQSAAVHETISAVDEIKSMSERNAANSEDSSRKVRETVSIAEAGTQAVSTLGKAIDDIVAGNDRIQSRIEQSNQELGKVVNVIREIDTKTRVINDIVFQTKLLSFNASVEAARAGEHGKGFSVVAEEVGNLAQMSGRAAAEISTMLAANVADVERLIRETGQSVQQIISENKGLVERGAREARACGDAITGMAAQIRAIDELSANIAVASKEQAKGVENISTSMQHLNQILAKNARIAQETAAASEGLSEQNVSLDRLAHDLAWSVLGETARKKLDPETEKAIDTGLKAHAEWKNRLIQVLKGTSQESFEPENVCKDHLCGLGKWIYGPGQEKYGKTRHFEELRTLHADFHEVACQTLRTALEQTQLDHKALIGPNSKFDIASTKVIASLASLKFLG